MNNQSTSFCLTACLGGYTVRIPIRHPSIHVDDGLSINASLVPRPRPAFYGFCSHTGEPGNETTLMLGPVPSSTLG